MVAVSLAGFPPMVPVHETVYVPELLKVWFGFDSEEVAPSSKSHSVVVLPGGAANCTSTRGAQPAVSETVICAIAESDSNERRTKNSSVCSGRAESLVSRRAVWVRAIWVYVGMRGAGLASVCYAITR